MGGGLKAARGFSPASKNRAILCCLLLAAAVSLALPGPLAAQKKPGPQEPYALVSGSVFRDPGFTQSGAKVVLALESAPNKALQEQVSSPTGEFAFRVTPGANRYVLTATLKGYETATKTVEIFDQEQIRATLMLFQESKNKGR
jgi:hypothetical protein